jgi:hypothetical protein
MAQVRRSNQGESVLNEKADQTHAEINGRGFLSVLEEFNLLP